MEQSGLYLIQLVTGMQYVVEISAHDGEQIHFRQCAWIASTGCRLGAFVRTGPTGESEIEVMIPGGFPAACVAAWWRWPHAFPTES